MPSTISENRVIASASCQTSARCSRRGGTIASISDRSDSRRPSTPISSVVRVISPSPPSWMNSITHACPAIVKWVAVSTTIRPVTHTALVIVNTASRTPSAGPRCSPGIVINPSVPSAISSAKLARNSAGADSRRHARSHRNHGRRRSGTSARGSHRWSPTPRVLAPKAGRIQDARAGGQILMGS